MSTGNGVDVEVIIAGGGPVGLLLAGELALAGVGVLVLERDLTPDGRLRAGSINGRTVEAVDRRGLVDRLRGTAAGAATGVPPAPAAGAAARGGAAAKATSGAGRGHFAGLWELRGGSHPVPPAMMVPQRAVAAMLAEWALEQGVEVRRGRTVTGLAQDDDGVTVTVGGPDGEHALRARYLVGCDGGRSTVRRLTGVAFPGTDPMITGYQAVATPDDPGFAPRGWTRTDRGMMVYGPAPDRMLVVTFDGPPADRDAEVTLAEVQAAVRDVSGSEVTLSEPRSLTRFTDHARQAAEYRLGRVLLAGDAAHVHSPFGGQGLNMGLQDAMNLGWKLAAAVGDGRDDLLDTYRAERHPVAERVLENTRAQVALMAPGPHVTALRGLFSRLLAGDEANAVVSDMMGGLDIRYDVGCAHPLAGRCAPDVPLKTAHGDTRLTDLLRPGRPVLLDLSDDAALRAAAAPWSDRVEVVAGRTDEPAPAVLVRPDGYVAWAADTSDPDGLRQALTRWWGPR